MNYNSMFTVRNKHSGEFVDVFQVIPDGERAMLFVTWDEKLGIWTREYARDYEPVPPGNVEVQLEFSGSPGPDIEACAALEHSVWARWAEYMLDTMQKEIKEWGIVGAGEAVEKLNCVKRWRRQIDTNYKDLSEEEKESDRKIVREKLKIYTGIAETEPPPTDDDGDDFYGDGSGDF